MLRSADMVRWGLLCWVLAGCDFAGAIGEPTGDPTMPRGPVCEPGVVSVGPSPLRRMNDVQFANTVRDLFGASIDPGDDFPITTVAHGYRTAAEANIVSATDADSIQRAAEHVAAQVDAGAFAGCDLASGDGACVDAFLSRLLGRAFRRPADAEEVAIMRRAWDGARAAGLDAAESARAVIEGTLQAPQFLYRPEVGLAGGASPGDVVPLDDHEVAARLSYFLWDTMPDEALFAAADAGALRTPEALETEARRMLADPRARPVVGRFFEDWLEVQRIDRAPKDAMQFPEWSEAHETWIRQELHRFVAEVIWEEDARFETLLTGSFTVVNGPLARIYGIEGGPAGDDEWRRVELDPARRAGLLTQPAFLASHANADSTSPIQRGAFVRNQLFCEILVPPPGVVTMLPPPDPNVSGRDRLARHRMDPACAGCHDRMDPAGFAFEHYDPIGAWRDTEGNDLPIDASGDLVLSDVDGHFDGAVEMVERLAQSTRVRDCMATQWMRFALGRREAREDLCSLAQVQARFAESDGDVRELIVAIVKSDAFRHRVVADLTEGE